MLCVSLSLPGRGEAATRARQETLGHAAIPTTNVSKTMTRQALQEATGLAPEALMEALKVLCGPEYDDDLRVRFVDVDGERITLGRAGLSRCEGTGLGT